MSDKELFKNTTPPPKEYETFADLSGGKLRRDNQPDVAAAPEQDAEKLAKLFHETYERLASKYGYTTRKESAVPWSDVPTHNKALMIATCDEVLTAYAESIAATLRAEIARLTERHDEVQGAYEKCELRCRISEDIGNKLGQENSTLRARIAELEAQVVNMAEIANFKEGEAMSEYYRAEAAEKRVATLTEALKHFARHAIGCDIFDGDGAKWEDGDEVECDCGLAAALRDQEGQ